MASGRINRSGNLSAWFPAPRGFGGCRRGVDTPLHGLIVRGHRRSGWHRTTKAHIRFPLTPERRGRNPHLFFRTRALCSGRYKPTGVVWSGDDGPRWPGSCVGRVHSEWGMTLNPVGLVLATSCHITLSVVW